MSIGSRRHDWCEVTGRAASGRSAETCMQPPPTTAAASLPVQPRRNDSDVIVGGSLLTHFFWGGVLWIIVPLEALAVIGQVLFVPNFTGRIAGRIDFVGAGLSIVGLAALVDSVIEGPVRGWLSATTLAEGSLAIAILVGFVVWELRRAQPLIDVRLFARRRFNVAAGALAVTFFALFGSLFVLTQYLQLVHGYSPFEAGLGALPFAGTMIVTSSMSSVVAKRLGARGSVALGLLMMGVGLGGLGLAQTSTPFFAVGVTLGVIGAGMGLVMAPAPPANRRSAQCPPTWPQPQARSTVSPANSVASSASPS
jgi:hypothetical protein